MGIDYFSLKKSSTSGKYYFKNKISGETQWPHLTWDSLTYLNTEKRLPEGWIRVDYNGKPLYIYIGDKIVLTSSDYHSPKLIEILQKSYEDLDEEDEEEKAEAYRRLDLFKKVAALLKLKPESIWDESLEYLAEKSDIPLQTIIDFIETTQGQQLGSSRRVFSTLFRKIKRNDPSFSSERSIRELCGVNMKTVEASQAMKEMEDLRCSVSLSTFVAPYVCSTGHTFEGDAIRTWILTHGRDRKCPLTNKPITTQIVPNFALRKVLVNFAEKYEHQRSHMWEPIREACRHILDDFVGSKFLPEHVEEPGQHKRSRSISPFSVSSPRSPMPMTPVRADDLLNDQLMNERNIPRTEQQLREYLSRLWPPDQFMPEIDLAVDMAMNNTRGTINDADECIIQVLHDQELSR